MSDERRRRKLEARQAAREACLRLAETLDTVPEHREDCPCSKKKCERHGSCRECYMSHSTGRTLPSCLRG